MKNHYAVVLFGGKGERFGSSLPKQFVEIGGKPLMVYTLFNLSSSKDIDEIVVVAPLEYLQKTADIIEKYHLKKISVVIPGGPSREQSALKGLDYLYKKGISCSSLVMIHDGDRPNTSHKVIANNFSVALFMGACITAANCQDSVAYSMEGYLVDKYYNRNLTYLVQTPQTFRFDLIYKLMIKANNKRILHKFGDEGKILRYFHRQLKIVDGDPTNIKITTQFDAKLFLSILKEKK